MNSNLDSENVEMETILSSFPSSQETTSSNMGASTDHQEEGEQPGTSSNNLATIEQHQMPQHAVIKNEFIDVENGSSHSSITAQPFTGGFIAAADEAMMGSNEQQQQAQIDGGRPASDFKEEFDSGDELPPPEEADNGAPVHEIRCGLLTAKLHMRRFTCPGIHRKCVEFDGKLISPRQFTIKAEKDKQKDWKGSIRLGKHNLRTLMEMKTLDFYEHATNCSLKCQSRNYIKNRKTENGSGGESLSFVDQPENHVRTVFEHGEPNDIKSVASTSSTASTRKSSAVLEDFVSQTVPSMGLSYGNEQLMMNGLNGIGDDLHRQNGHKTPQLSANSQPTPSTPTTASSIHSTQNGHPNGGNVRPPQQQQSPFQNAAALSLLQQSPLKQLFGTTKPQQLPHPPPYFPGSLANGTATKYTTTTTTPREANGGNGLLQDVSQEAALALLLQSVQTSLLMEQQQKAAQQQQQQTGGANNTTLLAQLAALNGLQQPQQNAPTLASLAALSGNGGNGIERLLTAAALFPQLQPKTPVKQPQEPVTVANIRKSMEETASLFWSQMRNMGLLDDMFKSMSETLEKLKQIYLTGGNPVSEEFAAQRLSGVALALDLCSVFGEKIHSRYIQATLESSLLSKELLELQRKQEEQKRKLEHAKRKSQVFDQLLKNGAAQNGTAGGHHHHHHSASVGGNGAASGNGTPELKKIHLDL